MTWCRRIARKFDVKSHESAVMVFQHALDCFCASISQPEKQMAVAIAIATKLNISKDKVSIAIQVISLNYLNQDRVSCLKKHCTLKHTIWHYMQIVKSWKFVGFEMLFGLYFQAEFYCTKYKPSVEIKPSSFTVGRVVLPRGIEDQISLKRYSSVQIALCRCLL